MFFTSHVIGKPGRMATSRGKFRLYVRNTLSFCERVLILEVLAVYGAIA